MFYISLKFRNSFLNPVSSCIELAKIVVRYRYLATAERQRSCEFAFCLIKTVGLPERDPKIEMHKRCALVDCERLSKRLFRPGIFSNAHVRDTKIQTRIESSRIERDGLFQSLNRIVNQVKLDVRDTQVIVGVDVFAIDRDRPFQLFDCFLGLAASGEINGTLVSLTSFLWYRVVGLANRHGMPTRTNRLGLLQRIEVYAYGYSVGGIAGNLDVLGGCGVAAIVRWNDDCVSPGAEASHFKIPGRISETVTDYFSFRTFESDFYILGRRSVRQQHSNFQVPITLTECSSGKQRNRE